jgi:hypothetical protein
MVLAVVLLPLRRNASAVLGTGRVIFDHSYNADTGRLFSHGFSPTQRDAVERVAPGRSTLLDAPSAQAAALASAHR